MERKRKLAPLTVNVVVLAPSNTQFWGGKREKKKPHCCSTHTQVNQSINQSMTRERTSPVTHYYYAS